MRASAAASLSVGCGASGAGAGLTGFSGRLRGCGAPAAEDGRLDEAYSGHGLVAERLVDALDELRDLRIALRALLPGPPSDAASGAGAFSPENRCSGAPFRELRRARCKRRARGPDIAGHCESSPAITGPPRVSVLPAMGAMKRPTATGPGGRGGRAAPGLCYCLDAGISP